MSKLKKIFALLMIGALALMTGCGGQQGDNTPKEKFLHIATGNTSGTYYPIGGAISEILNSKIDKMHSSVQATSGSIANLKLLNDGTVELAIVQNDIANYAINGTEMFKDENKYKFDNLRGIASLYPESCQFVVNAAAGINTIADLRGKKVSVGVEGSGAEANARQILEDYGLTYSDIEPMYLSFSAGAQALKDGSIDAAFLTAGAPTAAVKDVAAQIHIKILPIDDDHFKTLSAKYPFYTRNIIAKGTYQNLDEDVPTVSVMAILACNSDKVDANLGYQLTKTVFENLDTLKTSHPAVANLNKSIAQENMTLKFNDGAEKFFKE